MFERRAHHLLKSHKTHSGQRARRGNTQMIVQMVSPRLRGLMAAFVLSGFVATMGADAATAAQPLVNGGFESGEVATQLAGWAFSASSGCDGEIALDPDVRTEGARAVRLTNRSPRSPHVYLSLRQRLAPLFPGTTYRVRFMARGQNVGTCWSGGGPQWLARHPLPSGTFEWREFSHEIRAPDDAESYEFLFLVESETEALWIDDVRVEADFDLTRPQVRSVAPGQSRVTPVAAGRASACDGDLADWGDGPSFSLKGAEGRVDASLRLGWTPEALWLAVEARDDDPVLAVDAASLWLYDSVQVSLDPANDKTPGSYGPRDFEIGFAMGREGLLAHAWQHPRGVDPGFVKDIPFAVVREGDTTVYEIAIPWEHLPPLTGAPGESFGLNVVVNERGAEGPRAGAEWSPGTFVSKDPAAYRTLVLSDGPWLQAEAVPNLLLRDDIARLVCTLSLEEPVSGTLTLGGWAKAEVSLEAGVNECVFLVTGDMLEKGENVVDVAFSGDGHALATRLTMTLSDKDRQALERIAAQEARLPELEAALEAARADGLAVSYPEADLAIARMFCGFCRDDVRNRRFERAMEVAGEVEELIDRAEREMRAGVEAPVAQVGSIEIRDGSLWGRCTVGGREEFRPVFLTGYGHFNTVIEALPILQKIGINAIQFEVGPNSVVFEDRVDLAHVRDWVLPSLDRAAAHGVSVCLLLSPHYFPQWCFERWPEIRVNTGFLRNSTDAPQVREVYEAYLRAVIPAIGAHPALQSICLSNEPVSIGSAQDPFRLPLWHEYLREVHGAVETLNERHGTAHLLFAQSPHPNLSFTEPPARLYDAVRFNQRRFAEWHGWMADIVREMAPGIPCHAKVMALPSSPETLFWGTDPWDFAEWSQLNGNDCCFWPNATLGIWESNWLIQNMYYDLQRSMKRVPVFNTENHIIVDRERGYVDPNHIYTAIWQGAVHGQGASMTWAWERTYDAASDFEGLILHRAACTAAMSRCALDLMRLSYEMAAVQNLTPRAALLYSNAATTHSPGAHVSTRNTAYSAMNFCGVPLGFITDEQIAAGWLDRYDLLVVAGAKALPARTHGAIRAYIAGGGRAVASGETPSVDEYGRPAEPLPFAATLSGEEELRAMRDRYLGELEAAGIEPEIRIETADGALAFGVEWRTAELDGRRLVNMVNLTRDRIEVRFPGSWTDLITGTSFRDGLALEPNVPVLAAADGI